MRKVKKLLKQWIASILILTLIMESGGLNVLAEPSIQNESASKEIT